MFNLVSMIRHCCCPFCGRGPHIFEWKGRYTYYCAHFDGPYAYTREEAWDKWCEMIENIRERDGK